MRTTIELPDRLFRELKAYALQHETTLKAVVRDAVEAKLKEPLKKRRRMEEPPIKAAGRGVIPALGNAEMYAILDEEESLKVR